MEATKDRVPSVQEGNGKDHPAGPAGEGRRRRSGLVVAAITMLVMVGALLGTAGLMRSNARFGNDYVGRQLAEQQITFKAADALTPQERERSCLVRNAGKLLTNGHQAECYANEFIGAHLKAVADGNTYAQIRPMQDSLRAQIAQAQSNDPSAVGDLQRQLTDITSKRQRLFEGETLRGLLLTSYGFSVLSDKAAQAATVSSWLGVVVLVLALGVLIAGLWKRPRSRGEHEAARVGTG